MKQQQRFHRFNVELSAKQQQQLLADNESLFICAVKWKQYMCKIIKGKVDGRMDEVTIINHNQDKAKQERKTRQQNQSDRERN